MCEEGQVRRLSEVNYPATYGEISGNGGCWNTVRSDKESVLLAGQSY